MEVEYDKELEKDIASSLSCLRTPNEGQFVEFKRICLQNLSRVREISNGIRDALSALEPRDTRPLWYLIDYLLCELPLVFEDEFASADMCEMAKLRMPWVVEKGRSCWGPADCRALVDSWGERKVFNEVILAEMARSIAQAVEVQTREVRESRKAVSTSPAPPAAFEVDVEEVDEVQGVQAGGGGGGGGGVVRGASPARHMAAVPHPEEQSPSPMQVKPPPLPVVSEALAPPIPAAPAAADPAESESEDDIYDPFAETAAAPTALAKQLDAAKEESDRQDNEGAPMELDPIQPAAGPVLPGSLPPSTLPQTSLQTGYPTYGQPTEYQHYPQQHQHQHQHQHHMYHQYPQYSAYPSAYGAAPPGIPSAAHAQMASSYQHYSAAVGGASVPPIDPTMHGVPGPAGGVPVPGIVPSQPQAPTQQPAPAAVPTPAAAEPEDDIEFF